MADIKPLWMPVYVAEHLAETQALNTEQQGAYLLLQMAYFSAGGPLPDDEEELATITRMPLQAFRKAALKLARFFIVGDGVWRHERLDEELREAADRLAQRSRAGKASAARRRHGGGAGGQQPLQREGNDRSNGEATSVATERSTELEREAQREGNQLQLQESESLSERSDSETARAKNACQVRMQRVPGGAQRFAGIGLRPPGLKNQDRADHDLMRVLATQGGMTEKAAWVLVMAARDPKAPEHAEAVRLCVKYSKQHRLGWFPSDLSVAS
ncbi:MAG: YdaU family protein [Reyranellaceae bacterium]